MIRVLMSRPFLLYILLSCVIRLRAMTIARLYSIGSILFIRLSLSSSRTINSNSDGSTGCLGALAIISPASLSLLIGIEFPFISLVSFIIYVFIHLPLFIQPHFPLYSPPSTPHPIQQFNLLHFQLLNPPSFHLKLPTL